MIPSEKPGEVWKRWAEELTVVDTNWRNFGFLASGLFVEGKWRSRTKKLEEERRLGLRSRAREDACLPVIDVVEDWRTGAEVLAIGAGVNLVIRKRKRHARNDGWWRYEGERVKDCCKDPAWAEKSTVFELLNNRNIFFMRGRRDDPQDYTAVHLLSSQGNGKGDSEIAVVGKAAGTLEMVRLSTDPMRPGKLTVLRKFKTPALGPNECAPRIGKYTSVIQHEGQGNQYGLMSSAVGLGSSAKVSLYQLRIPSGDGSALSFEDPVAEVGFNPGDGELWTTNLLSPSHLAVSKTGCLGDPLAVFAVTPDGIRRTPLRTFPRPVVPEYSTNSMDATATARLRSFTGEFSPGQVFLTAWSRGDLRYACSSDLSRSLQLTSDTSVHDLRCSGPFVARWANFVAKPVRSLHVLDSRKVLMGHSESCMLRVLDIRTSYAQPEDTVPLPEDWSRSQRNWLTNFHLSNRHTPEPMDPVYALAVSPWSEKSVYAATPGMLWELNFAGRMPSPPPVLPDLVEAPAWKKGWLRSKKLWKKPEEEKETLEPTNLTVRAYNGLLWGMHHPQTPRKMYQRYD